MSISKSGRASFLEVLGVTGRLACFFAVEMISTTKLVRTKRLTTALAPDHFPTRPMKPQLVRTLSKQVDPVSYHGAVPLPFMWGHRQGDVEPINQAHAVRGEVGAREMVLCISALGAAPDAAGPVGGGGVEGAVGEAVEEKAATFKDWEASVGLDGGPDGIGAVVDYGDVEAWILDSFGED